MLWINIYKIYYCNNHKRKKNQYLKQILFLSLFLSLLEIIGFSFGHEILKCVLKGWQFAMSFKMTLVQIFNFTGILYGLSAICLNSFVLSLKKTCFLKLFLTIVSQTNSIFHAAIHIRLSVKEKQFTILLNRKVWGFICNIFENWQLIHHFQKQFYIFRARFIILLEKAICFQWSQRLL